MQNAKIIDKLALVHVRDRRVLLTRSYGKTALYLPGGKRDEGESDIEALRREISEELDTRLRGDSVSAFGVYVAPADGKAADVSVKLTCYSADLAEAPRASAEIAELVWANGSNIAECSLAVRLVVNELIVRKWID
jgi:8-oxo-dGTP diphosphatase